MLATTSLAHHSHFDGAAVTSTRTFYYPLPAHSPRSVHELTTGVTTSPYASMNIPFFDRGESNALCNIAARDYHSLTESVSTDGLVAKLREDDKAAMQKIKGTSAHTASSHSGLIPQT